MSCAASVAWRIATIRADCSEARASEQSARMVAMRQATDAAQEMVGDLTLAYNKARQETITAELLDIVGGTAAIEQK